MTRKKETKDPQDLSYEEAFGELEQIVESLESGELPLEQALAEFERGQALAKRCAQLLDQAELKLTQLVSDDEGGYVEEEFEPEDA